ncbi:hypothetical protein TH53_17935 [Pedobacter lusitanus]|uniref:Contig78, whole genome shotgun sequence n=1 Tax=Pedobacter lusitanus TaxID=1503925 RepID=A0A0D0GF70_9SPHI|nr:hypothetical protein [Pedobacter lusitanus]KIO75942.1 hypothetical protein TH53_17935 [Pedobacter lusitanus]
MWYKIDFKKLTVLILPTFLRQNLMVSYIQALVTPVSMLYQLWYTRREDNLYKLAHNGQVCYLRKALNDLFDNELRRIYIDNGNRFKRTYIYTRAENRPRYLKRLFLQPSTSFADTGADFKVMLPAELNIPANYYQLNALVDFYKLASKRYTIETI